MQHEGYVHGFQIDADHSLHIYQGSLARVQADALVSSDNNYLFASTGVSLALAQAAGFDVTRERQKILQERVLTIGDIVRTSGGGLPCRYLYHAITIDFDRSLRPDETTLRSLIANLLKRATNDDVRSIGLPALGTGALAFDLDFAAEIIVDELLIRLVDTPVERVILALIGDEAERLFYERLVRSRASHLGTIALRRCESRPDVTSKPPHLVAMLSHACNDVERVEQFPNLVDETRLSSAPPDRPRLVDGLSELILRHADADDIERELLRSPECRGFRGTVKQRLMEFLYLSEDRLRKALGPALFKNKDLRRMANELGEDSELPRDQDQLIVVILRSLCFNTLAPPTGIGEYIARVERLLSELRGDSGERTLVAAAIEAGKILEHALKDLLRLYGCFFFGIDFEAELLRRRIVASRRDGNPVSRLTIGQALEALEQLNSLMNRDNDLRAKWLALGRTADELLPRRMGLEQTAQGTDCRQVLREIITARNDSVHTGDAVAIAEPDEMVQRIQRLHAFLCTCQAGGTYPDVLRYEGTYENRSGERFVYFLDENGRERKVRTDDKIDARRHYYCFATNNPIHLHPTLVPKLH